MKTTRIKTKFLIWSVLVCLFGLAVFGYVRLNYFDGYKKIDLKKNWPKGQWLRVEFVEINFGKEWVNYTVPEAKLDEFERTLKHDVHSRSWHAPISDLDQLRIVTDKGKYYVRVLYDRSFILGETWRSEKLRELLNEWGFNPETAVSPAATNK